MATPQTPESSDLKILNSGSELPACYVASPYGFAESTSYWYKQVLLPMLGEYVKVLDPWAVNIDHITSLPAHARKDSWLALGDHHFDTIKNQARLVIAGLDQEPPDIGTVAELVWAAAHNIPIIGYRGDVRESGEDGMSYNLMVPAAIRRSGGITVASLVELKAELSNPQRRKLYAD